MTNRNTLTPFQPGSIREMVTIALPLMIISLSENIMLFFDRVILSHYSLTALNAATLASQAVEIFQFGLLAITGICEIFVARLFAQNQRQEMAKPCWQMVYLSLALFPIVIILSSGTGDLVLPRAYQTAGLSYYKLLMYSVPLIGITGALAGFFIGQGKFKLVFGSAIAINAINLLLDFVFIFGVKGWVPSFGAEGAAISAIISLLIQVVWLFLVFLNKKNRRDFKTHHMQFNLKYFIKSIRVGLPISASHAFEMLGWLVLIRLIAETGVKNFTIISIGSTLFIIFTFLNDGIYRSLSNLISHHIAAHNYSAIHKSFSAGLKLLFFISALLAIPFIFTPNVIIGLFNLKSHAVQWAYDIRISFIFMWLYFVFYGIYYIVSAVFVANQRSRIVMITNITSMWIATILPMYVLARYYALPALWIWPLMCVSVLLSSATICFCKNKYFK